MSCPTKPCCPSYGGIPKDENCTYNPGGSVSLLIARKCDIQTVTMYTDTYQSGKQDNDGDFTTAFGLPLPEWEPNLPAALYQEGAVADIDMAPYGGPPGPVRTPWGVVGDVRFGTAATPTLQGGDGSAPKYFLQTLVFQLPRADQFAIRRIMELGQTEIVAILEIKQYNRALAEEVAFLLGPGTSPVEEGRRFIFGLEGGLFLTAAEGNYGGGRDDLTGYTCTFENEALSPAREIIPFTTDNYNTAGGSPSPGKYISAPYIDPLNGYSNNKPICNFINKLLRGDA